MPAFPFCAPIEDQLRPEVETWPFQEERKRAIFLHKAPGMDERSVKDIGSGEIRHARDVIA